MKFEKPKPSTGKSADQLRQESIVFQNALAHATKIICYNSSITPKRINVDEVLELARKIAKVSMRPDL